MQMNSGQARIATSTAPPAIMAMPSVFGVETLAEKGDAEDRHQKHVELGEGRDTRCRTQLRSAVIKEP